MILLQIFILTGTFLTGMNYSRVKDEGGYGILDKNAGEYICHSQLKEFDGFEDGMPKCK